MMLWYATARLREWQYNEQVARSAVVGGGATTSEYELYREWQRGEVEMKRGSLLQNDGWIEQEHEASNESERARARARERERKCVCEAASQRTNDMTRRYRRR